MTVEVLFNLVLVGTIDKFFKRERFIVIWSEPGKPSIATAGTKEAVVLFLLRVRVSNLELEKVHVNTLATSDLIKRIQNELSKLIKVFEC
jgi:hypothetical protein